MGGRLKVRHAGGSVSQRHLLYPRLARQVPCLAPRGSSQLIGTKMAATGLLQPGQQSQPQRHLVAAEIFFHVRTDVCKNVINIY
jgi:hypothetical protein